MVTPKCRIAVVGSLGIFPIIQLSIPARRILADLAIRGRPVLRKVLKEQLMKLLPNRVGQLLSKLEDRGCLPQQGEREALYELTYLD